MYVLSSIFLFEKQNKTMKIIFCYLIYAMVKKIGKMRIWPVLNLFWLRPLP